MKSNPAVYPSEPFPKINITKTIKTFQEERVDWSYVVDQVNEINHQKINIEGVNLEEKVFSIFLDKNILFGPKEFVGTKKSEFLLVIKKFIDNNEPIQFTLLGFPFKMEVPLKTNRILPDMGEILVLEKLFFIVKSIQSLYVKGAVINIFTEEAFADIIGLNKESALAYVDALKKLVTKLKYQKYIKIFSLGEMEQNQSFNSFYKKNISAVQRQIKEGSGRSFEMYEKAFPVFFRLMPTNKIARDSLLRIYNSKHGEELNVAEKKIHNNLFKRTDRSLKRYLAYLKTRDDLNFLENKIGIHLPLSVSPKIGRLGIMPINERIKILPYHGVPIKDSKTNAWDIKYLCEVEYDKQNYSKIFLNSDQDKHPFFYIRQSW